MNNTRKYKTILKTKKTQKIRKTQKTNNILIKNTTPNFLDNLIKSINFSLKEKSEKSLENKEILTNLKSYTPTINYDLISFKSGLREEYIDCNNKKAFKLKEKLKIGININGIKKCYYYDTPETKKLLLKNLSLNKHINPKIIIPPIQSHSNCWFNAMFITFFVSNKGRKFFHFFRELMIEGKQKNGKLIPPKLSKAFALLNYSIDLCLTGNNYAYKLDTNSIIHTIYKAIPSSYEYSILDIDEPGNPLSYYNKIINYLNNNDIMIVKLNGLILANIEDKSKKSEIKLHSIDNWIEKNKLPHIIVLEYYDNNNIKNKPLIIDFKNAIYKLDSAVVRDIDKQHFCSVISAENKEMAYDGYSFTRLMDLKWKNKINKDYNWEFEGTRDYDNKPLQWNFLKCYQLLYYYREK